MNIIGTVVTIEHDVQIAKSGGGSYTGTRLAYRDSSGSLKEQNFHEKALKFNKAVNNGLQELSPGDPFTIVKEKEGEYWNVKQVFKGSASPEQAPQASKTASSKPAPTSTGGNWPTAEERAQTQVHIIRQNSVTNAVNYINAIGDKKAKPSDVIKIAKEFEAFIHGRSFDDGSIENLADDIIE